jgi:hypothetical protein
MNYKDFLKTKKRQTINSGFQPKNLNSSLFPFQKYIVDIACKKGKFAIFADCGLGKTLMQLSWAEQVANYTNGKVLILAPLAVVEQTKNEAKKFNINTSLIDFTNYDQLKNIDTSIYVGVVLDESSIMKGNGKLSNLINDKFINTPYKLACTATPSPNDHMELGRHSEFLGGMTYLEMLAMFFVHDGGQTSKWRLRGHAKDNFWKYVCTWSISIDNPNSLGFSMDGYNLPKINYIEHFINVPNDSSELFANTAVSATDIHKDFRKTKHTRLSKVAELVNNSDEQWIVWGLKNDECAELSKMIEDSVNVQGSDKPQVKADNLNRFAKKEYKCLITKTSIASFGMNFQQSFNQVFLAYDFKFEAFYQAVRRQYRFGQTNTVNVHLMIPESQMNVKKSIEQKQLNHKEMMSEMSKYSSEADYSTAITKAKVKNKEIKTEHYHLINGDCVEKSKTLDTNSADLCVFSPPFAELYTYSDKDADMGNSKDYKQFESHFKFLIPEIKRVLKHGRIVAIHCMDLPIQKGKEGFIGLRDFSGMLVKWFTDCGFIYHSRTTIWKNPVTEMQRTKALGLLHKTIKKDSSMSRVGIPDYVLFFRNEGDNETPIEHQDADQNAPNYLPVDLWQKYASPVWMDVDYSRTLNYRSAKDNNDEKHICPLQLDTIERIIHLYSNEGETVFSPFGGIGSEGCQAIKMNRKSISIELKESYFEINEKNHRQFVYDNESQLILF